MKKHFIDCPYWGKGGRYVVDPQSGRRIPVDESAPAVLEQPAISDEETPAEKEQPVKQLKEKKRA